VEDTASVVVATEALAFGAAITSNDVKEIHWPSSSRPEGVFSTVEDLTKDGRRVVLSPFVKGEPIVAAKVSAPNGRASLSAVIEEGKRAVTVAVDDVRGVAGFIFPGDYVDVVLTRTNTGDGPQDFSEVILQHIKVLAIDQVAGERQERPTVAKAVTVEVTPEQALKILLATNVGRLSLILRQSAEVAMAPDARITDKDLYEGEPVEAPKAPVAAPAKAPDPPPPPTTRKITVVRAMKGEVYDVPLD
jgi:pilus assembly protein CpaB